MMASDYEWEGGGSSFQPGYDKRNPQWIAMMKPSQLRLEGKACVYVAAIVFHGTYVDENQDDFTQGPILAFHLGYTDDLYQHAFRMMESPSIFWFEPLCWFTVTSSTGHLETDLLEMYGKVKMVLEDYQVGAHMVNPLLGIGNPTHYYRYSSNLIVGMINFMRDVNYRAESEERNTDHLMMLLRNREKYQEYFEEKTRQDHLHILLEKKDGLDQYQLAKLTNFLPSNYDSDHSSASSDSGPYFEEHESPPPAPEYTSDDYRSDEELQRLLAKSNDQVEHLLDGGFELEEWHGIPISHGL